MDMDKQQRILQLLHAWRAGDRGAFAELMPLVYRELHRLAQFYMRRERPGHTLQATALVNEAFARLIQQPIPLEDSTHFYVISARLMRHVLLDHAKARTRLKRERPHYFNQDEPSVEHQRLVEVDGALRLLEKKDPNASRMVELYYFGGLTHVEIANALEVSESTVERTLRFAKAWLSRYVEPRGK